MLFHLSLWCYMHRYVFRSAYSSNLPFIST